MHFQVKRCSDGASYTDLHFYAVIPTLFGYFLACHHYILLHFLMFFIVLFGVTGGLGLRLGDGFPVTFSGALKGQNITHSGAVCIHIYLNSHVCVRGQTFSLG